MIIDKWPIQFRSHLLAKKHEQFVWVHLQQQLSVQIYEAQGTPFLTLLTTQYHPVTQKARPLVITLQWIRPPFHDPTWCPCSKNFFERYLVVQTWSCFQLQSDWISKAITGFICKWGTFISNSMPFGVVGGSFDMQHTLDALLGYLEFRNVYIDLYGS
jgi:hypothetical protein